MAEKDNHIIFAIERKILFGNNLEDYFQGFREASNVNYEERFLQAGKYMRRGDIESNPEIKHPIPYCIIVNPKKKMVFAYQRAIKNDEDRLAGKWSWGVGGHVDKQDTSSENVIYSAMLRELLEEVDIQGKINPRVLGYINDDSNLVGQVHLGVLYILETDAQSVRPTDNEIERGELMSIKELERICLNPTFEVENWSRIALDPIQQFLSI